MEGQSSAEQIKEPKYDAIIVLGAVMDWNAEKSEWDFPTVMEPGPSAQGAHNRAFTKQKGRVQSQRAPNPSNAFLY